MNDRSAEHAAEEPRGRSRRFRLIMAAAVFGLLVAGLMVAYYAITVPVIPAAEMERYFAEARAYHLGADAERLALGDRYEEVLAEAPTRSNDVDWDAWEKTPRESAEYREGVKKWLAEAGAYLDRVRAVTRSGPGALRHDVDRGADMPMPWLVPARDTAQLLAYDTAEAARTGNLERVIENVRCVETLAETVAHRSVTVGQLVAVLCRMKVWTELIYRRGDLDDKTLETLIAELASARCQLPATREAYWGETFCAQSLYRHGLGNLLPVNLKRVNSKVAGLILQGHIEVMAAARKPTVQALAEMASIDQRYQKRIKTGGPVKKFFNQFPIFFVPGAVHAYYRIVRETAACRGTLIVLAIERYRRKNDRLPPALTELVPAFLPELPNDPYSGNAFLFRPEGNQFELYCVGVNQIDDGGATREAVDSVFIAGNDFAVLRVKP